MSLRARAWHRANTFAHAIPARAARRRARGDRIGMPAGAQRGPTIGPILEQLVPLRERGVVDQIVVVDDSTDGTAEIARGLGAEVHDQEELMPELGPVLGKGDAMWRALPVLRGEVICFLDADSERFGAHFACGVLGPLLCGRGISFVKGFYRRPFRVGDHRGPGRRRPRHRADRPAAAQSVLSRPRRGRAAARRRDRRAARAARTASVRHRIRRRHRAADRRLRAAGLDAIAQVDLDVRQNAHQPLRDLGPMAYAVLHAVASRLEREGRLRGPLPAGFARRPSDGPQPLTGDPVERPPLVSLRAAA